MADLRRFIQRSLIGKVSDCAEGVKEFGQKMMMHFCYGGIGMIYEIPPKPQDGFSYLGGKLLKLQKGLAR